MVNSMSVTSPSTKTISGRAEVTKITSGIRMVDTGFSYLGGLHRELFHYPSVS